MARNTAVLQLEPGRPSAVALLDAVPPQTGRMGVSSLGCVVRSFEAAQYFGRFEMLPARVSLVLHGSEEVFLLRTNDDVASTAAWTEAILKNSIRSRHALK